MELNNEFDVPVSVDEAWNVLTDIERIAPCMPGAELTDVDGDTYHGVVKVKVGPITAQYQGTATFQERDDVNHRVVLAADGRDTRGQGNANATITALLESKGSGTHVAVTTDLVITGKVAQFGRGVMGDVSAKLLGQFAECLQAMLADDGGGPPAAASDPDSTASGARSIEDPEVAPLDLVGLAGASVLKRVVPVLVVVAAIVVLLVLLL